MIESGGETWVKPMTLTDYWGILLRPDLGRDIPHPTTITEAGKTTWGVAMMAGFPNVGLAICYDPNAFNHDPEKLKAHVKRVAEATGATACTETIVPLKFDFKYFVRR